MPQNVPQDEQTNWTVVQAGHYDKFRADVASAFRWLIHTLDETERRQGVPRSDFDEPVQRRTRRAS
ncbi:MAG TPA: hypothetical protein V6D22_25985 [Candidatus Obscuribacterales bacterium]